MTHLAPICAFAGARPTAALTQPEGGGDPIPLRLAQPSCFPLATGCNGPLPLLGLDQGRRTMQDHQRFQDQRQARALGQLAAATGGRILLIPRQGAARTCSSGRPGGFRTVLH